MKRNYSYTYLLPLVEEKVYFPKEILNGTINTYALSKNSVYEPTVFTIKIKLDFSDSSFISYENLLIKSPIFLNCFSIEDCMVYVFKFPEEYLRDRQKFILGKYSEMSTMAKKKILAYWTGLYGNNPSFITGPLTKIKQILFKEVKLKQRLELELGSIIDDGAELGNLISVDNETFDFSGISLPADKLKNI